MSADSRRSWSHAEMWEHIPWLVNGRLAGEAAAPLNAHLEQCGECAREYAQQLRIYGAMQADDCIAFASEASFQKLAARLDTAPEVTRVTPTWRRFAAGAHSV
jgi:anti-sigma factor RsiW